MKFIVDKMLDRLAKWLRLFGYDAVYFTGDSDKELVFESIRQRRILLTRDTGISGKKPFKLVFLKSEKLFEQIEQLRKELKLEIDENITFTRCVECNTLLEEIQKEKINDAVPPFVFKTHDKFSFCSNCKKVYWKGSHIELAGKLIKTF